MVSVTSSMLVFLIKMSFKIITSNYIFISTKYERLNISYIFFKYPFRIIADLLKSRGMVDFVNRTYLVKCNECLPFSYILRFL